MMQEQTTLLLTIVVLLRPSKAGEGPCSSSIMAQVVGWPPIRSFRKNSIATSSKNVEEMDGKAVPGALYIKISMDGASYLRKVDLRNYSAYQELSATLDKMFNFFTICQYGTNGSLEREMLSETKLKDLLHCTE
ncbi:auxin-responsive protein IAA9-like isoform X3 [Euphorbia lathyris]